MAEGGLDPPDPRIRLVNGSWRGLTHKHGVVVRIIDNNNNNNNCLKSNIQCIEIRVQWTVHLGSSHMHDNFV